MYGSGSNEYHLILKLRLGAAYLLRIFLMNTISNIAHSFHYIKVNQPTNLVLRKFYHLTTDLVVGYIFAKDRMGDIRFCVHG